MKETIYESRIHTFEAELSRLERFARNISLARLAIFVIAFTGIYFFASQERTTGIVISIIAGLILFLALVKTHSKVLVRRNITRAMLTLNRNERDALKGIIDPYEDGVSFLSPEHPYSDDLDLFGPGSLFQYLNRTSSRAGWSRLASLLQQPFHSKDDILLMQEAVDSMTGELDWRQRYQATGLAYGEGAEDQEKIEAWADSRPVFSHWAFRALVIVVPLLTTAMIVLLSAGMATIQQFLVYLVVPWGIAGSYVFRVNSRHNLVSKTSEMLQKHALLLQQIEDLQAGGTWINDLRKSIMPDSQPASRKLRSLSAILTALDNRLNFVAWGLLNGLFLWDILQMIRLENWQKRHRDNLHQWFRVIAEFDVISAFANFRYNQEDCVFPEVIEGKFRLEAKEAGHPLIDRSVRVDNEIRIRQGEFLIITGANMAGKSTYLRTVGVGLVMAMCGAPVVAASFRFTPIQVYSSIRTRDSLRDNESYFYAELKRLKAIIDTLRRGRELFIILDEILKGTNSKDKHAGSEALLRQLIDRQATGIVATHDVLLGQMVNLFPRTYGTTALRWRSRDPSFISITGSGTGSPGT